MRISEACQGRRSCEADSDGRSGGKQEAAGENKGGMAEGLDAAGRAGRNGDLLGSAAPPARPPGVGAVLAVMKSWAWGLRAQAVPAW